MATDEQPTAIDSALFREVLGHYPTGVVLVTALAEDGEPVGMVVGSFTSVSLDPPLVAFLPSTDSQTFARMRGVTGFAINVLSAEQEDLCRVFSSRRATDKWATVSWQAGRDGTPLIEGAVAWIECDVESIAQAGDHAIVIGRVTNLQVVNPTIPLLFFQGGYGRFIPSSLLMPPVAGLVEPIRYAELARPAMDRLSKETGANVVATAVVNDSILTVASSGGGGTMAPYSVGVRAPYMAPLGPVFAAWQDDETVTAWLQRMPPGQDDASIAQAIKTSLARVRERGYSVLLDSPLLEAVNALSGPNFTPAQEREYRRSVQALLTEYQTVFEPEDLDDRLVKLIGAPILGPDGQPVLVLQLRDLPHNSEWSTRELGERLRTEADTIAARAGAHGA